MSASISRSEAEQVLARWWCAYDEGEFEVLDQLLEDDVHFRCRTDTGTTSFEDFVRADMTGRDKVMWWQSQHRLDSPYPLRHHLTNFHLTGGRDDLWTFRHYLSVSSVKDLSPSPVPGGVVEGSLRRRADGTPGIAELVVVLDTMDSVPFREARPEA